MKKIINGKMYNTETAELLDVYWNGLSRSDFRFVEEYLYLKKTGEYFLYCRGGGMTPYASHCGNVKRYGEKIIPFVNEEAARNWAEINCEAEKYIEIFGEPEE